MKNNDRRALTVRRVNAALLVSTILCSGLAVPVLAQIAVPPVRSEIDENGVDLTRGTFNASSTDVSIGAALNGMAYTRYNFGGGSKWRDNLVATMNFDGTFYTVSIGGSSDRFDVSLVSTEGNGATLVLNGGTNEYSYTTSSGTVAVFEQLNGRSDGFGSNVAFIKSITLPNGDRWTYSYKTGQWCDNANWNGTACTVTPNQSVRIQSVTNRYGYQLKLEYAANPAAAFNYTTYLDWSRVTKVNAINNAEEYCNPTADTCALVQPWPYVTYTRTGATEAVADRQGARGSYTYGNTSGGERIVGIRRPTSATDRVVITYGANSEVSNVTSEGVAHTYTVTINGNTRLTQIDGNVARSVTTLTDQFVVTQDNDSLGRGVSYLRDANWRVSEAVRYNGGTELGRTVYAYDARGNVTSTTQKAKPGSGLADIVASATYSATCTNTLVCNMPLTTTDAKGNVTDYTYDATHGGALTVTLPAALVGGTRPQTRYNYTARQANFKNSAGTVVASGANIYVPTRVSSCQTTASCLNAADEVRTDIAYGVTTATTPNNLLPVSVTTTNGTATAALTATTAFTYDKINASASATFNNIGIGNRITVNGPMTGTTDTVMTFYDARRRVTGTIGADPDAAGARPRAAQRITYNLDNRVTNVEVGSATAQTVAGLNAMTVLQNVVTTYDANARPVKSELKSGATTYAVTQSSYDSLGRPLCVAQRMDSAQWAAQTDACVPQTTGALGADRISRTTYNSVGEVLQVQSAYGTGVQANEVTYSYADSGLTAGSTGQLLTAKDGQNNLTTYEYDGHGRLQRTRFPSATLGANTSSTTDYEELTYDANSNATSRRLRDGQTIAFAYDNLNRLTTKTLPSPELAATYTYDLLGRNLTMAQNGRTITNTWDALSRLTSVNQAPLGTVNYAYDSGHTWRRIQYPGTPALTMLYAVNVAGELTSIRENATSATTGTAIATYAYDNFGRRASVTRGNGAITTYAYDPVSRLASLAHNVEGAATANDVTHSFTYNPASQIRTRLRSTDAYAFAGALTQNELYGLNGLNQASDIAGTAQGHDGRGNLITSGAASYSYTAENMMKTAPNSASLSYDPGLRLYETVGGGVTTRFLYDGSTMIAEYNGSNVLQRRYASGLGADDPVTWYEGSATLTDKRYLITDERGSVIGITNSAGTVTNKLSYDEHGVPAATNVGRFQFTGQAWLPEVGLYHYKARMYSPKRGKFMQTDPIGYGNGMNIYAYVRGDAVNATDPSGLAGVINAPAFAAPDTVGPDIIVTAPITPANPFEPTNLSLDFSFVNIGDGHGIRQPNGGPALSDLPEKTPIDDPKCALALAQAGEVIYEATTATLIVGGGITGSRGSFINVLTRTTGSFFTIGGGGGADIGITESVGTASSLALLNGGSASVNVSAGIATFSANGSLGHNSLTPSGKSAGMGLGPSRAGVSATMAGTKVYGCKVRGQ
jgi:RHS repeat-associated protein